MFTLEFIVFVILAVLLLTMWIYAWLTMTWRVIFTIVALLLSWYYIKVYRPKWLAAEGMSNSVTKLPNFGKEKFMPSGGMIAPPVPSAPEMVEKLQGGGRRSYRSRRYM